MVNQSNQSSHEIGPMASAEQLADLKEKIDALADMPEKGKLYKMAANMSASVLDMAIKLDENDPDRVEAMDAVSEMVDATFELKEADNTIVGTNDEVANYSNDTIKA